MFDVHGGYAAHFYAGYGRPGSNSEAGRVVKAHGRADLVGLHLNGTGLHRHEHEHADSGQQQCADGGPLGSLIGDPDDLENNRADVEQQCGKPQKQVETNPQKAAQAH